MFTHTTIASNIKCLLPVFFIINFNCREIVQSNKSKTNKQTVDTYLNKTT